MLGQIAKSFNNLIKFLGQKNQAPWTVLEEVAPIQHVLNMPRNNLYTPPHIRHQGHPAKQYGQNWKSDHQAKINGQGQG